MCARAGRAARRADRHAQYKATAPAIGISPSVHGRASTCQQRPPMPSKQRISRGAEAAALFPSPEAAQHAGLPRVRAALRGL